MSDAKPEAHQNIYLQNVVTGATTNPVMQNPDAVDEEFMQMRIEFYIMPLYSDELFDRSDKLEVKFFIPASFTGRASNF